MWDVVPVLIRASDTELQVGPSLKGSHILGAWHWSGGTGQGDEVSWPGHPWISGHSQRLVDVTLGRGLMGALVCLTVPVVRPSSPCRRAQRAFPRGVGAGRFAEERGRAEGDVFSRGRRPGWGKTAYWVMWQRPDCMRAGARCVQGHWQAGKQTRQPSRQPVWDKFTRMGSCLMWHSFMSHMAVM